MRMKHTLLILLFPLLTSAQVTNPEWIEINGKIYKVTEVDEEEKEAEEDGLYDFLYEQWKKEYEREQRSGIGVQAFDPLKIGKSVFKWIRKSRLTILERKIFNEGVGSINEKLGWELFTPIEID